MVDLRRRKGVKHKDWRGCGKVSGDFFGIIRRNAKSRGIKLEITIEFIWKLFVKQKGLCALSKIPLNFPTNGRTKDGTASLDRIRNEEGYTENNVRWVHKDVNLMKRCLSDEVLLDFCKRIVDNAAK